MIDGLQDQTSYLLCLAAEDEYFNLQSQAVATSFTTTDGTPPQLHLTATPFSRTAAGSTATRLCAISANVTTSEQCTGVVAVFDTTGELPTAAVLLKDPASWPANDSSAVEQFKAFTAKSAGVSTITLTSLPCDMRVTIIAAAQDLSGNVNPEIESVTVTLPDVTPPHFVSSTPRLETTSSSAAWFDVALDEPGEIAVQVCIKASRHACCGAHCHAVPLPKH